MIKKIFFKNNTNNKIILKKEEKCISCIDAKIKIFFYTKKMIEGSFFSYDVSEIKNIKLISKFNTQMLNFLKSKKVYNLTEDDLLELEKFEIAKKCLELHDLCCESFSKFRNFINLYFDYLEILENNPNLSEKELKLLEKDYLNKIENLFN